MVRVGWHNEENDKIIEIKKKYESDYPDLKNIFNLREVLDYFLNNNVKLSKQDCNVCRVNWTSRISLWLVGRT